MQPPSPTRSSRLLRAGLGLLLALALFAGLEGLAWLLRPTAQMAKAAEQARSQEWLLYSPELGWRRRPGYHGVIFGAERSFDADGLLTADTAAARRAGRRVLFLGDSRTFGNGVPTPESFAELLGRTPGIAAINLGVPGHSSYQGYAALRLYAPRFRPDVVVFAYGFNDRRYSLRPEEADGERQFRRLVARARFMRLAHSLALVDLLRGRPQEGTAGEREAIVPRPLDLATVVPRVSPEDWRRNLSAATRFCRARHIRLILLLLNDNPNQTGDLERGVGELHAGRFAQAEPILKAAAARNDNDSDAARLYLSRLYTATGRPRQARAAAVSPRTFYSLVGGYPIDVNSAYRAIALEVAAAEGVTAVDAGAVIDRHPEWYFDICHFNRDGHRAVAALLAPELAAPVR